MNRSEISTSRTKNRFPRLKGQTPTNEVLSVDFAGMQSLSRQNHGVNNIILFAVETVSSFGRCR